MKDLSNDIIKSIEERAVKPVPRWQYVTKKILFWVLTTVGVLSGALVLALAIYIIQSIDWNVYHILGYGSMAGFFMRAFPYAFILILALALIFAYYFYRHTPKGHRINYGVLISILITFGLSLTFMIYILGISQDAYLQLARMPYYHQMMFTKEKQWSQPERGLLWGEVLNVGNNNFSMRDFSGKNWNVSYDNNTSFDANITEIQGQDIKIIGQKNGDNAFQAKDVQVWDGVMNCRGHRNMMMNMHGNRGMMGSGGMMGRGMMNWR